MISLTHINSSVLIIINHPLRLRALESVHCYWSIMMVIVILCKG